jgi:hypothetical protein
MEGKQRGVRWEKWMVNAIATFGERNGMDFSGAARFLVECELNERGFYRKDYEPGVFDKRLKDIGENRLGAPAPESPPIEKEA